MNGLKTAIALFGAGLLVGSVLAGAAQSGNEEPPPPAVTGIGGVFFKADDPGALREWYRQHLGIEGEGPGVNFFWREPDADLPGFTVWSLFARDNDYFGPGEQDFMINYRVRDLDGLLERLEAHGVRQIGRLQEYEYGRFAWIDDAEGNRVELWEPVDYSPEEFERLLEEQREQ